MEVILETMPCEATGLLKEDEVTELLKKIDYKCSMGIRATQRGRLDIAAKYCEDVLALVRVDITRLGSTPFDVAQPNNRQ